MLSPMVARRRGRPCMKRKVSKVDAIVNRLKGKSKKPPKADPVHQCQPQKLNFPGIDDMQDNTYHEPATQTAPYYFPCMDGTQQKQNLLNEASQILNVASAESAESAECKC
ncbi:hypothetical protein LOK49_LG03G02836 [Camellia lanceoleosa]|uniref:Uncharacterized protein n=1 Tax=Camellia lanceoleosa TaxID=1840588 RepID=A0ACC0I830_9ERIC|nr:hypothetical protein LOK49_LG03G02836 [Camellia lanceoleosa]